MSIMLRLITLLIIHCEYPLYFKNLNSHNVNLKSQARNQSKIHTCQSHFAFIGHRAGGFKHDGYIYICTSTFLL